MRIGPLRNVIEELSVDQLTQKGARLAKRVDEHVGERIRLRRTMLGFTQEQLAAVLDISYQQVQKYETGANRVSAGRLYEIASHLDVEMGYFFEGLAPTARSGPLPHGGRNRVTIELVRNFSGIADGDVRNAVSTLVKVLANPGEAEPVSAAQRDLAALAGAGDVLPEKDE
ncbi:MAG: helix-turn-helix transcriptional regulator [Alphaproteobacteria bacterium]|nr:helix-turn-helix transcriptional regulator [Alphaproteobacteria bacterium]